MLVRRSGIKLNYQGVDITKNIERDLLSFSYTDNAHGVADDVSITMKDEKLKWLKEWFPGKGDKIIPMIYTENWRKDKDSQSLDCGSFIIDEPSCSGPPSIITINGNSMPSNSGFKDEKKTKAWHNHSIKKIAKKIASDSGLNLLFDSTYNPTFKYQLQKKVSDASFLLTLCNDHDFGMKISSDMLILFSMDEYVNKDAVYDYTLGEKGLLSYNCRSSLTGAAYTGVNVRYKDKNKKIKWYKHTIVDVAKPKIYKIESIAEDYAAAEKMVILQHKKLSRREFKISFTVVFNLELVGGVCITIKGFGEFDGKYFIDKVSHTQSQSSVTSFEARRVDAT